MNEHTNDHPDPARSAGDGDAGRRPPEAHNAHEADAFEAFDAEALREQVLLSRVVDHEASPADWAELEQRAVADPAIWHRLACAERAHARLSDAVEDAIAIAECVDLPLGLSVAQRVSGDAPAGSRHTLWSAFWKQSPGWLVAACLAVMMGVQAMDRLADNTASGNRLLGTAGSTQAASLIPESPSRDALAGQANPGVMQLAGYSPDDLWSGYVRRGAVEGQVIREMPAVVVEVRMQEGSGAYELIVERRVRERRLVSPTETPIKRVFVDEFGQPVAVPVDPADELNHLLGPRQSPI